jgi:hypothetical protein
LTQVATHSPQASAVLGSFGSRPDWSGPAGAACTTVSGSTATVTATVTAPSPGQGPLAGGAGRDS